MALQSRDDKRKVNPILYMQLSPLFPLQVHTTPPEEPDIIGPHRLRTQHVSFRILYQ